MELFLRDNDVSNWITVSNGVQLKIEYPTYEQEIELSGKLVDCQIDGATSNLIDYFATLVKYCVKDWKGITNIRTGEEIECRLKNNTLDPVLLAALVRDADIVAEWGGEIRKQIEFDNSDKKKLQSADTSTIQVKSQARKKNTR